MEIGYAIFRQEFEEAIAALAEKYDISFDIGTIRYNELGFKFTVTALTNGDGNKSGQQLQFEALAPRYGLRPEDYGATVVHSGQSYTVVGINPKARKYNVLIENNKGEKFSLSPELARIKLSEKESNNV